jgi:hypothetical protein
MPVVSAHRAQELRVDVEGQKAPVLLALLQEVQRMEGTHQAVQVHQLVVVAGLQKDPWAGPPTHSPATARRCASCPITCPLARSTTGWNKVPARAAKTRLRLTVDDLKPSSALQTSRLRFVEVMDEFGERHDGSP